MSDLLKHISSRLEYWAIRCKTQGGLTDTDENNLIRAMDNYLQFTPRIPMSIATQLGSCLQGASFLKHTTRAKLNDMIDSKVAHVETVGTIATVRTKVRTIEFYQSHKCWARYASDEPDDCKLFCMAAKMAAIGIRQKSADEITFAEAEMSIHGGSRSSSRSISICIRASGDRRH